MRNVTIVESNVEPNKEHLWFYNGKLKWFGPNGWEEIYSQALSPTTTPKPVVPPATTTTSTAPGPGVATTPIGVRVYNYMDATIDIIVSGANSVNRYIPANGDAYIEGVYPSTSGGNITLYIKVRGSISPDIQVNRVVDVNIMGEISGTSIEQFKSILNEGTIDIPYTGSDALHSISLVVSISDGDTTTTTSSPIPGSDVRFTNNTNTDIQIYGVLYNGDTASPPMQPGQIYILRYISDGVAVYSSNYRPFDSLKITAFRGKVQEDVPYIIDTDTISNGTMYKFPEGLSWEEITEISIEGSIQGTGTTSSTPRPDPSASTTTSTPKPTTTTSSTPIPNSIQFKNKTNVSLTLSEVNAGNGASVSPPILPDGDYILGPRNDDAYIHTMPNQVPFNSLEITAFKVTGESLNVPYESEVQSNGSTWYKFSFKELVDNEAIEVIIKGYVVKVYNETYPDTTLAIAITGNHLNNFSPSEIHYSCDFSNTVNIKPPTPTKKYLAVLRPKTSNSKDTIVAEIKFNTSYEGQYSLYPIETTESESNKLFLFDLSTRISDMLSIDLISLYDYNSHTISTIPPFVDGNIPPFADEK